MAANTADPYRKCAKIENANSGYVYVRNCYEAYYTEAYMPNYPNNDQAVCFVAVGNDTGVHRGLRGFGYY